MASCGPQVRGDLGNIHTALMETPVGGLGFLCILGWVIRWWPQEQLCRKAEELQDQAQQWRLLQQGKLPESFQKMLLQSLLSLPALP